LHIRILKKSFALIPALALMAVWLPVVRAGSQPLAVVAVAGEDILKTWTSYLKKSLNGHILTSMKSVLSSASLEKTAAESQRVLHDSGFDDAAEHEAKVGEFTDIVAAFFKSGPRDDLVREFVEVASEATASVLSDAAERVRETYQSPRIEEQIFEAVRICHTYKKRDLAQVLPAPLTRELRKLLKLSTG